MNRQIILTFALIFGVSAQNRTRVHGVAEGWMIDSNNFDETGYLAKTSIDVSAVERGCVSGDGPCTKPDVVWLYTFLGCCMEPDEALTIQEDEYSAELNTTNFTSPWRSSKAYPLTPSEKEEERASVTRTIALSPAPSAPPTRPSGRLSSYVILQSWYSTETVDGFHGSQAEHLCLVSEKKDNYTAYSSKYYVTDQSVVAVEFLDTRFLSDFIGRWWLPFPKLTVRVVLRTENDTLHEQPGRVLEERVCHPSAGGLVSCLYRESGENGWADIDGVPLVVDVSAAAPVGNATVQVEVDVDFQGTLKPESGPHSLTHNLTRNPNNPIIPPACLTIALSNVYGKEEVAPTVLPDVPFFGTRLTPTPTYPEPRPEPAEHKGLTKGEDALIGICVFLFICGVLVCVHVRNRKRSTWADNPELKESLLCGNKHDVLEEGEYRSGSETARVTIHTAQV